MTVPSVYCGVMQHRALVCFDALSNIAWARPSSILKYRSDAVRSGWATSYDVSNGSSIEIDERLGQQSCSLRRPENTVQPNTCAIKVIHCIDREDFGKSVSVHACENGCTERCQATKERVWELYRFRSRGMTPLVGLSLLPAERMLTTLLSASNS